MAKDKGKDSGAGLVDITGFLSHRILVLSSTLGRWASREYASRFGVSLPEWRILSVLAARSTLTAQEIAEILAMDKAIVSKTLAVLVDREWVLVKVDREDRRRRPASLTAAGRSRCLRISQASKERQRRLVEGLPPAKLRQFSALLEELQCRAEAMLEEQASDGGGATKSPRTGSLRAALGGSREQHET